MVRRFVARGYSTALDALYRHYGKVVHGLIVARSGWRDADDLTQEVFAQMCRKIETLRDPAAFGGWICSIARNVASDYLRQRMRRPLHEPFDTTEASSAHANGRASQPSDLQRRVLANIGGLPEAYREPLILRLMEGLTGPEIADRTGLTHGSVRVNLSRGMGQLRARLAAEGWP
jgi:RNA polymerase sigma-70 factor (ECF subfamily)